MLYLPPPFLLHTSIVATSMSIHLIDNDGHLLPEKKVEDFLTRVIHTTAAGEEPSLNSVGVNYHLVGVFGGQSSGKSTLLNHLFGTDFQTLDETVRRGQTTKGAFMASATQNSTQKGTSVSPLLVVDFEGTDGLERGEDQNFERQLSLFGLSAADTLIINMWAVDVGRFNAANLSLLRTIFEVNLQLFSHDSYQKEEKPTLLIILRDFTEEDPNPSLVTVRKSFDTIWESISRPETYANAPIDELFNLKYYVMPHYRLQKQEFMDSVLRLTKWFVDPSDKDYLFEHKAMFRGVPLEGLPSYFTNCWDAIINSKDLDIPTQRELLAQHRCKDSKEEELKSFLMFTRHYDDRIARGEMLLRLTEVLEEEMDARLESYRGKTKLYNATVVREFEEELQTAMVDAVLKVVRRFSASIAQEVIGNVETRLQGLLDDCLQHLFKASQVLPLSSSSTAKGAEDDEDEGEHPATAAAVGQYLDNSGCQHLVRKFWKSLKRSTNGLLDEMVANPPSAHLFGRYTSLIAQDHTARSNVVNEVTENVFNKLFSRFSSMAESASETMHRCFEQCLTHNADGSIRYFATATGLQKAVPGAQQAALVLMGTLLYFRLRLKPVDEDDLEKSSSKVELRLLTERKEISYSENPSEKEFMLQYHSLDRLPKYPTGVLVADGEDDTKGIVPKNVLLSEGAIKYAFDLFRQNCAFTTQLQMRSIEAGKQRLPAWVPPALLILGWNELMYVVKNPILLLFVIAIVFFFFKNYIIAQWEAFMETGPSSVTVPLQVFARNVQQFADKAGLSQTEPGEDVTADASSSASRKEKKDQ
ncbi:hypothetical protein AGDE_07890 [Angomonas deanei]|nr:hypothetical protein AGDE_07890 [Angomonas deanei]|eukprot:EPY34487.1 hypothetical protein AGDE_07890 [Angomonas deanei]